jgi:hypothetical protein
MSENRDVSICKIGPTEKRLINQTPNTSHLMPNTPLQCGPTVFCYTKDSKCGRAPHYVRSPPKQS